LGHRITPRTSYKSAATELVPCIGLPLIAGESSGKVMFALPQKNGHSLGDTFNEITFVSLPPTLPIGSDSPKQIGAQLNERDRIPGTEKNLPVIQLWDFQSCS
jgi:hypothetical protein